METLVKEKKNICKILGNSGDQSNKLIIEIDKDLLEELYDLYISRSLYNEYKQDGDSGEILLNPKGENITLDMLDNLVGK